MDCAIYILIPTMRLLAINQGISTHNLQTRGMCIRVIHWYLFAFQDMPMLDHIEGTCLPGKAFADCFMVADFLHSFKHILDIGEKEFFYIQNRLKYHIPVSRSHVTQNRLHTTRPRGQDIACTARCHYKTVNFLQNLHYWHPIACWWRYRVSFVI